MNTELRENLKRILEYVWDSSPHNKERNVDTAVDNVGGLIELIEAEKRAVVSKTLARVIAEMNILPTKTTLRKARRKIKEMYFEALKD